MMHPKLIATYDEATVSAVRAMFDYSANEGQQKTFLDWLMFNVCKVNQTTYQPGDTHATAYAEGARSVALQVAFLREKKALDLLKAKTETRQK